MIVFTVFVNYFFLFRGLQKQGFSESTCKELELESVILNENIREKNDK